MFPHTLMSALLWWSNENYSRKGNISYTDSIDRSREVRYFIPTCKKKKKKQLK